MQYEFPEWKVYLMVYQRERDDEERGKTEEDQPGQPPKGEDR